MNANDILFRCSSNGYLMPDPKEKLEYYLDDAEVSARKYNSLLDGAVESNSWEVLKRLRIKRVPNQHGLSESTLTHLVDVFVSTKYGRREEAHGKALEKGKLREEDSITLVSRTQKTEFRKNSERLTNAYIQGEPDMFTGETIRSAETIRDTKTSWSAYTFFRAQQSPLDKKYWWQMQGYLALTGAKVGYVDYCLVNGTAQAILDEKRKTSFRYGIDCENDPAYVDECRQIERNHIFDLGAFLKENPGFDLHTNTSEWCWDIPKEDRHFSFVVDRNDEEIERLYKRIRDCRVWMNQHLFKVKTIAA